MRYQRDPFEMMADLRRRLYRLLESNALQPTAPLASFRPPLDIARDSDGLVITVELPGVAREEVDVRLEGDLLTISGERKSEAMAGGRVQHRERPTGRFLRSLHLAGGDYRQAEAVLRDGVLTVTVGKASGEGSGQ